MAILKHIASKSSNYGAVLEYLIFKHDELRKTLILDQNGNRIMRDEYYLDGLNCEPYSFDAACQQLNREYQKNKNKDEIKSHHYIVSFDPRDSTENCLTGKRAQELGLEYAKANFPGHQALVCTHMDGHNGSGNIHVHIVMMMNLIAELSTGGKTPDGCKIGAPQKVIYQCSEDGVSDTIKPRLERCGADCKKIAFINEEVYSGVAGSKWSDGRKRPSV